MSSNKHIVAFPYQEWGHVRPLTNLVARLVKLRPVLVTLLVTDMFYERCKTELSRSFEPGDEEAASRVKIISIGSTEPFNFLQSDSLFADAWKGLIEEGTLMCTQTGICHHGLLKPHAIILDFFAREPFLSIKARTENTVKVFAWYPALVYAAFHLFGPKSLGGAGNIQQAAQEEATRSGKSYEEIIKALSWKADRTVVRIPAMPPMYAWEYHPQDISIPEIARVKIIPGVYQTLEAVDGILVFTPERYEPGAVAAMRGWFGETGRPVYVCGPLLPSSSKAIAAANEMKLSRRATEIQAFLEETLERFGERKLLYLSLGSIFWPVKTPEKMWAFLDVVMELSIPFILSHASPFAVIPDYIKRKVKEYGRGLLSPWTPQQLILDHPATGWFVAHGGQGGVTEAISAGVPQILWPFTGDQPLNAVHIADNLGIGYELLEVRTGHGLKQIYRTGFTPSGTLAALQAEARDVLKKAFGEDGAEKRVKLEVVRKAVIEEWEEGGASKRDVLAFLDSL